ncbi:MAG TPA: hypothetical protein VGI68_16310, partial [Mycobacterium sp.]
RSRSAAPQHRIAPVRMAAPRHILSEADRTAEVHILRWVAHMAAGRLTTPACMAADLAAGTAAGMIRLK